MRINTIAVVGSGYMGGGIAQVFAARGHRVVLADKDLGTARAALDRLTGEAAQFEQLNLMPASSAGAIRANLAAAPIEEAVSAADYVTEAVPEDLGTKLQTLRRIAAALPPGAIVGTNTSAIPIGTLAAALDDPSRFLGVHWMNPAPFVPGVELIPHAGTAAWVVAAAQALITGAGKNPALVADTPGFVANRLQFALFAEAVRIVEEGTATPAQVDAVVRNTFGFRLALFGPFAIGDMAGLDVYRSSYATLEAAYGERFAAPESLSEMVASGNLGLKSGHGYLDIPAETVAGLRGWRDQAYARLSGLKAELGPAPGIG